MPFFGRSKQAEPSLPISNPHNGSQVETLTDVHTRLSTDKSTIPPLDTPAHTDKDSRPSLSSAHSSSHEHHTLKDEVAKTLEGAGLDTTDGTTAVGQIAGAPPAPAPEAAGADAAKVVGKPAGGPGFHSKIEMSRLKFWAIFVSLMLSIFLFALDQLIVSTGVTPHDSGPGLIILP